LIPDISEDLSNEVKREKGIYRKEKTIGLLFMILGIKSKNSFAKNLSFTSF
jgi:hypothetical protein